jgi:isopenicillin-N epimerase
MRDNTPVERALPEPGPLAGLWDLDPGVVFLNHGSFGATPRSVLAEQGRIRVLLESDPVAFFERRYQPALDVARAALAGFVGARPEDLVFVANATTGVNTVLRSLELRPGDQLLVTDHEYNACRNALEAVAAPAAAVVEVVRLPFPLQSPDDILDRVLERVTARTRLLLIDHVTSQTALVMPLESLVREVQGCGVDVLVDGAHAPGMLELDLTALGAAYYTGNCHKWMCAPKGAGFLVVREDLRSIVRPLVISHGANARVGERSRHHLEHDWTGTRDPSAWLSVPASLEALGAMVDGGWPEVRRRNHELVLEGRRTLAAALGLDLPCPDAMIGSMASLPLPDARGDRRTADGERDPVQEALYRDWAIQVPVIPWPAPGQRLLRLSAQLYNSREQTAYLAEALLEVLSKPS